MISIPLYVCIFMYICIYIQVSLSSHLLLGFFFLDVGYFEQLCDGHRSADVFSEWNFWAFGEEVKWNFWVIQKHNFKFLESENNKVISQGYFLKQILKNKRIRSCIRQVDYECS